MDVDQEITEMQQRWLDDNRHKRRWIIVEDADGYSLHVHSSDGVAPQSSYPTERQAASRLLQLLHIGPVAPQTWPEEVCIGTVSLDGEG